MRFAVDEQFHRFSIRDDVDGLDRRLVRWITPVAENVQIGLLALNHAVREVNLLRQAHRIYLAAHTRYLARILPAVRILIGEINRAVPRPPRMRWIGIRNSVLPVLPV